MKRSTFLIVAIAIAVFASSFVTSMEEAPSGMVLVPGGESIMGSNEVFAQEAPVHEKVTKSFYMDIHSVTVAQVRDFVQQTGYITEGKEFGSAGVFQFV